MRVVVESRAFGAACLDNADLCATDRAIDDKRRQKRAPLCLSKLGMQERLYKHKLLSSGFGA
jgi:hypothetical protein